jgi:hypothetical protein
MLLSSLANGGTLFLNYHAAVQNIASTSRRAEFMPLSPDWNPDGSRPLSRNKPLPQIYVVLENCGGETVQWTEGDSKITSMGASVQSRYLGQVIRPNPCGIFPTMRLYDPFDFVVPQK